MIIIHGDDIVASRNKLNLWLEEIKARGLEANKFDAGDIDLTSLTQILDSTGLFGMTHAVVIFSPFSQIKSKKNTALLNFLKDKQKYPIAIYENKSINANSLKSFTQTEISKHEYPQLIFQFLESLKPNYQKTSLQLFKDLLAQGQAPELIFAMVTRHIRMLIQAYSSSSTGASPWLMKKLNLQAKSIGINKLLALHGNLYQIDKAIKTGRNNLGLTTSLFDFILSL